MNRRDVLRATLEAIFTTTRREADAEGVQVLVTDNNSEDDTPDMLREMEQDGKLRAWLLPENLGTSGGRNAHFGECIGHDTVRLDDKALPLVAGWLTTMRALSEKHHALLGPPYDPTVRALEKIAPCVPFFDWPHEQGQGGPVIFIPAQATEQLGGIDELPGCRYGWDDCAQVQRAMLLGWHYGFCLNTPWRFTASASPERRAKAMEYHPLYLERLREYKEAERDVFVPIESTEGYKKGLEARG